jgi:hypothetical protein
MRQQRILEYYRATKTPVRLAAFGLLLVIFQLTGCASASFDEHHYNPITGYPVVGDRPWGA